MMPAIEEFKDDLLSRDGCPPAVPVVNPHGAPLRCAVAIGAFDGCHRGHVELLDKTIEDARRRGIAAVAVTFDPDPDQVVGGSPALKLMTIDDRVRALSRHGVRCAVVPFDRTVASMGHEEFFDAVLGPALSIEAIHVGSDFRLGARGASTVEVIRGWGAERGIEVHGHDLLRDDGEAITATRIRALIALGDMDGARRELGRRYIVRGCVRPGRGEGTGMGFPTANIEVPCGMQLPADGVYAGFAALGGMVWPAAINVGLPPMFAGDRSSAHLEANLLGYHGDLYGSQLTVVFDRRLRPSRRFSSVDRLIEAVHGDIASVREAYGDSPMEVPGDF